MCDCGARTRELSGRRQVQYPMYYWGAPSATCYIVTHDTKFRIAATVAVKKMVVQYWNKDVDVSARESGVHMDSCLCMAVIKTCIVVLVYP